MANLLGQFVEFIDNYSIKGINREVNTRYNKFRLLQRAFPVQRPSKSLSKVLSTSAMAGQHSNEQTEHTEAITKRNQKEISISDRQF
jgi:hypothetical protein